MNEPHRFQPVHFRHENVHDEQVEVAGFEYLQAFVAVIRDDDAVAIPLKQKLHGRQYGTVIVDSQDIRHRQFPPRRELIQRLIAARSN